jgi:alkylhydroperoxidase family enzyme
VPDPIDVLRAQAAGVPPAPPEMEAYLEKVRTGAYAVTDEDVEALKANGFSEDAIFEQTVACAVAEGLRRLDAAGLVIG